MEAERWFLTRELYDSLFLTCPVREPVEFISFYLVVTSDCASGSQVPDQVHTCLAEPARVHGGATVQSCKLHSHIV